MSSSSASITLVRVVVLIVLAALVWVPIGVWIGLRPQLARQVQPWIQFLAAFPANLFFPLAVSAIVVLHLNPEIWLSPLMILGTQWYILFNVIAGTLALPTDYQLVAGNLGGARLAVVAAPGAARHLPGLRHRRRDRRRAGRGTPASSRRSRAGATPR